MDQSQYLFEVTQEAKDRTPEGFERYIASLFDRCGGWVTEVTPPSGDYGADVLATSPTGTKYAIQAKHYWQSKNTVGVEGVQEVVGSLGYYKAHHGIVVTSGPGYTNAAHTLAEAHGVMLWTLDELAVVLKAAKTQSYQPLLELKLHAFRAPPPPPEVVYVEVPTPVGKSSPRPSYKGLLISLMIVALALVGWRFVSPQPVTYLDTDSQVLAYLNAYDEVLIQANRGGETEGLERFLAPGELSGQLERISNRRAQGCQITTVVAEPNRLISVSRPNDSRIIVRLRKDWQQSSNCAVPDLAAGAWTMEYTIDRFPQGWLMTNRDAR